MAYHSKYSGVEVDALLDKIKDDNVGSIDSSLSTTSENPVKNKVITEELNKKANKTDIATINGQPLTNGGNIEVVTGSYDDTEIKGKLTELAGKVNEKQDALNAGQGISINHDTKTISCTLDTTIFKVVDSLPTSPTSSDENKIHLVLSSSSEEGNTYDEYLWTNNSWERMGSFRPSVDLSRYAEKSYVDSQIKSEATARTNADAELQTQINSKQEALTLTVKDNGNIVLANIQGQSKEFMPATPSGDPMHYAYVAAGAEYNDTGADIVKTTPWADMVDDDYTGNYGKTVVHKAGYWYLNGLGNLNNIDMDLIYAHYSIYNSLGYGIGLLSGSKIKTLFNPMNGQILSRVLERIDSFSKNSNIMVIPYQLRPKSMVYGFNAARTLIALTQKFDATNTNSFNKCFDLCVSLMYIKITNLSINISFSDSLKLSVKSVLYMINKETAPSSITITLHADVYNRCMANADILAALQVHTNISLASAQ